ncbi:hypothetical protein L873DRAFT_1799242 [Choiromyces venosus 120613-1]|uniref:Uncharacterized protein n=1 Tax=Choiromyces venosus 120613-1 TaxID=1336337 RepID=A0A3N4K266_9PEZI|nr:hypothetical protein L873DRAFT_1799242 [Choiromyces venosus 120613-1]
MSVFHSFKIRDQADYCTVCCIFFFFSIGVIATEKRRKIRQVFRSFVGFREFGGILFDVCG